MALRHAPKQSGRSGSLRSRLRRISKAGCMGRSFRISARQGMGEERAGGEQVSSPRTSCAEGALQRHITCKLSRGDFAGCVLTKRRTTRSETHCAHAVQTLCGGESG
jgi:hypothetical protein